MKGLRVLFLFLLPYAFMRLLFLKLMRRDRVICLIFHDVPETRRKAFLKIINFINKWFGFITPQEFSHYLENQKNLGGPKFLLSFDDGFKSSAQVLEGTDFKAIYFCCSKFVGKSSDNYQDFVSKQFFNDSVEIKDIGSEKYPLTCEELEELSRQGHWVASHTCTHANLAILNKEERSIELQKSKDFFKPFAPEGKFWFAYPFGGIQHINEQAIKDVSEHYEYCFSGLRGEITRNSASMALPRTSVDLNESFALQLTFAFGASNFLHAQKLNQLENWSK